MMRSATYRGLPVRCSDNNATPSIRHWRAGRLRYILTAILIILWSASLLVAADKAAVEKVTEHLSCYCGGCPHLPVNVCGCSTADKIQQDVGKKLDAGMTEKQIIDAYVAQYGQTILSMPPSSGFSLTAWLIPFLGFALGGTVLVVFLKRQKTAKTDGEQKSNTPDTEQPEMKDPSDDYYREQLKKELEKQK